MENLALASTVLLIAVFVVSGFAKLFRLDRSRQAARDLGIPAGLAPLVGTVLPAIELAIAGLLIAPPSARVGLALAGALLGAFSLLVAGNLVRGRHPDCNCFGTFSSRPIGLPTLARNGALFAAALFAWTVGGASDPASVARGADATTLTIVGLFALLGAAVLGQGWMIFQLLRQHGRLLLRLDQLEAASGAAVPRPLSEHGLPVGTKAPEFSLTGLHGETMTLAALRAAGKPVLLVFSEAGCGPCNALMPDLASWQHDYANKLTVAVVTAGASDMNRAKAAEHDLVNVLLQVDREVATAYRFAGTPGAVLVDVRGRVAAPLVSGGPAISGLVERIIAGVPVALGRHEELHRHAHGHSHDPTPEPLAVGSPAPTIALPALGGGDGALSEFAGHRVVVLFWSPRCGFCRDLLPRLLAWERDRQADSPELLVVSSGDEGDNAAEGFISTVLLDVSGQAMSAYGATGTPMAVVVDADGNVAAPLGIGAEGVMTLLNDGVRTEGVQR